MHGSDSYLIHYVQAAIQDHHERLGFVIVVSVVVWSLDTSATFASRRKRKREKTPTKAYLKDRLSRRMAELGIAQFR